MSISSSILVIGAPDNFDEIQSFLQHEEHQLHYASNRQEALEQLNVRQPDVILINVIALGASGIEICRTIKAHLHWQLIPIILVTDLSTQEDLAQFAAAGADDFICQPVSNLELRARIRSMLQMKQNYENFQTLLKLQEDMLSTVVHDLRNPLASILLAAEMLQLPGFPSETKQKKVEQIAIAGRQLKSVIDSLLLMTKLESGKMILNCEETDLCALCLTVVQDFQAIANQKSLQLISQLPNCGGCVNVDPVVFRYVLNTVLSNAAKVSPAKSQITLAASFLETGTAKIQIADSGPLICKEVRETFLEKIKAETLMKDISQVGLGFAFCRMAIESHGGTMSIEHHQPKGSIFTLSIPCISRV